MKYIVMEIQNSGSVATLVTQHDTKNDAEAKFHAVLAAAAISSVPVHSAVLLTDEGVWLRSECYKHEIAAPVEAPEDAGEA